jgi:hypothetical protein
MRPPSMSLPKGSRGLLRGVNRRHARAAEMPHVIVKLNESYEGRVRVEVRGQPRPPPGLPVRRRSRHTSGTWACSARFDFVAPGAAKPRAARRRSAASQSWSWWSRHTSGTWAAARPWTTQRSSATGHVGRGGRVARAARGRARLAAVLSRRVQPNLGPPGADPPPAEVGRGGRVARAARGRARLVALMLRRVRPTLGPLGADPTPAGSRFWHPAPRAPRRP